MKITTNIFETLRHPAYTGENRCPLCTRVNSVIAVVLSAAVGVLAGIAASAALGVLAGGAVLGLSTGMIYFRGYLVPGTPELTMKYFPRWVLEKFGKVPGQGQGDTPEDEMELEVDLAEGLQECGALAECPDIDDLCLTEEFRQRWFEQYDRVAPREGENAVIAEFFDVDEDEIIVLGYESPGSHPEIDVIGEEGGNDEPAVDIDEADVQKLEGVSSPEVEELEQDGPEIAETVGGPPGLEEMIEGGPKPEEKERGNGIPYTVMVGNNPPALWPSREALFAEIAAANVFEDCSDAWSEYEKVTHYHLLSGLRLFLDSCPSCGTDLTYGEETVESCNGTREVFAVTCEECDSRIFEE